MPDLATSPGVSPRSSSALAAASTRWDVFLATRSERRADLALGTALAAAGPAAQGLGVRTGAALAEAASLEARLASLRAAVSASLDEDRADWAEASAWLRPVAIVRGFATRALLRDRAWRTRRVLRAALARAGAVAVEEGGLPDAPAALERAREAHARREAALQAHALAVAAPVPRLASHASREAVALSRPFLAELRGRLVPKVPGVAGLAVGWWIARTYTDSRWSAFLHGLGFGHGPRRVVSTERLHAMQFWLPLAAAAVCSYVCGRVAALVRARYGRRPDDPPAAESRME